MFYSYHIHTLYLLTLASRTAGGYLEVVDNNNTVIQSFKHKVAEFGGDTPDSGIKGRLIYLKRGTKGPCDDYEPAAPILNGTDNKLIALMETDPITGLDCNKFDAQVYAVQNLKYSAVIVHNDISNGNKLVEMTASEHFRHEVNIPSVFVGYDTGVTLRRYIYDVKNDSTYFVRMKTEKSSLGFYVFLIVCFLLNVFIVWIYHYYEDIVKRCPTITWSSSVQTDINLPVLTRIRRLSKEYLSHIRPSTFSKDDTYDVCPICLENFETKEKLWKLPCDHQFHINCIKPAIQQVDASCPVCRRMFVNSRH